MLKNLTLFRLLPDFPTDPAAIEAALAAQPLRECGPTERVTRGWVPFPEALRSDGGHEYVVCVGRQMFVRLGSNAKILPAAVVKRRVAERVKEITQAQGSAPGRRQRREIAEMIELELLPQAFSKQVVTHVWIDPVNHWLGVDAPSATRADEVVESIRLALQAVPLAPVRTNNAVGATLTEWVLSAQAPGRLTIDRDGELQSNLEGKSSVRYANRPLDHSEVRENIASGMTVSKLAMTWNDRISFMITDELRLRRITLLEVTSAVNPLDTASQSEAEAFQAEAALWTGEVAQALDDLVAAFGGEADQEGEVAAKQVTAPSGSGSASEAEAALAA